MQRNKTYYIQRMLSGLIMILAALLPNSAHCEDLAAITAKIAPSVVNISVSQIRSESNEIDDMQDFMREFFERGFFNGRRPQRRAQTEGFASGFIIDPTGYIVTNYHVIDGANEIKVTLSDDAEATHKAKVIGKDERTDLALLKIETKKPLPYIQFDVSREPQVGEEVIAIGNPLGLGGSVTKGIISAKTRVIRDSFTEYLQTDASINKGNSGGPLCSAKTGKVIGVNTAAMFSQGGGVMGIGFALPASKAQSVISQLKDTGSVVRGWLGILFQEVDEGIAKSINLPKAGGGLVIRVEKNSPAEKAGIRSGDVILKIQGEDTNSVRKIGSIVSQTPIGNKIEIDLFSEGKKKKVYAVIEKNTQSMENAEPNKVLNDSFGLTVETRKDEAIGGVIVSNVSIKSPAYMAGLRAGDVILGINQHAIKTVDDFKKYAAEVTKSKRESAIVLVMRGKATSFVTINLKKN